MRFSALERHLKANELSEELKERVVQLYKNDSADIHPSLQKIGVDVFRCTIRWHGRVARRKLLIHQCHKIAT